MSPTPPVECGPFLPRRAIARTPGGFGPEFVAESEESRS